jgi:Family of unknown function (DUF5765)
MCWSMQASIGMVVVGSAAVVLTLKRRDPTAIPLTFGYFTLMEALQAAGYPYVDQCGSPMNHAITVLSYLHIAFQPCFINAFAMAITGATVRPAVRLGVYLGCGLSADVMLLQLYPFARAASCTPGWVLCGAPLCLVSGNWHVAWDIPYNNLVPASGAALGLQLVFPGYLIATFVLPLAYGAWRFVVSHAVFGPLLASRLTVDPNEMPAVWCLFSIALLAVGLVPWVCVGKPAWAGPPGPPAPVPTG